MEAIHKEGDPAKLIAYLRDERAKPRAELLALNREIAAVAYLAGDFDNARKAIQAVLAHDPDDLDALNSIGHIYRLRGPLGDAERAYKRVLELSEENSSGRAAANGNIGVLYLLQGDLDKTEEYCLKALDLNYALDRKDGMANQYGDLGIVYKIRGDLDKAEEYYLKSLEFNKALGRKEGMASVYGHLGNLYLKRGDLDKAEEYHLKSLNLNEASGSKEGMVSAYSDLGDVYLARGDHGKAIEYWDRAGHLYSGIDASPNIEMLWDLLDELREDDEDDDEG
ncbi:MAG: tetratricopeptide repeat protein [Candidatus Hydrogenedentota bacterium]